jgi:hypothetical protein
VDFSLDLTETNVDPVASDNFASGFYLFNEWYNSTNGRLWKCVGDGVWTDLTASDIGSFNPVITNPQRNDILQYIGGGWINNKRYSSQVIVKSLADLPAPIGAEILLATSTIYVIDTDLDITGFTLVFGAKTQINGLGQNVSVIRSSTNGTVGTPYVFFKSVSNLFMNDIEVFCDGTNQRIWQGIGDGVTVPEGESFELNRFNAICTQPSGHNNELGYIKDIRQGFMGTMSFIGFENGFKCAGDWTGGFRIDNTIFINCSGTFFGSDILDPVTFARRVSSNANVNVPLGSIGYDFPETAFSFTGQYQLQNGNASGDGIYVSDFTSGFPAFDPIGNFRNNTGIQNTFQGGEWVNSADQITIINTVNVWEALNVVTFDKFLTWFSEANGIFTYNGGNPLDVTMFLTLSVTGKSNDIVQVRLMKESSLGIQTEILRRSITVQGSTTQGRAESVPIQSTEQLVEGDLIFVEIRNTSGTSNVTTLSNSNLIIGAK